MLAAGPADRVQRLVVVGVERGAGADAARLGRRVADRVVGAEAAAGLLDQRRRRGAAADHDVWRTADRSGSSKSGVAQQQRDLGGHAAEHRRHALARRGRARRRPASGRAGGSVDPSRRYQGSLVVKPMWANWVPASIGGPARRRPTRSPTSMRGDGGELALGERGALGQPGRARREHDRDRPVGVGGRSGGAAPPGAVRGQRARPRRRRRARHGRVDQVEAAPPARAAASRGLMPAVTAPSLGGAEVGDDVAGGRGEREQRRRRPSPTPRRGAATAATASDRAVELGVAERSCRRRSTKAVRSPEAAGRLADDGGEHHGDAGQRQARSRWSMRMALPRMIL